MHPKLASEMLRTVRQRISEGDNPVTPAFSVEQLEGLVDELGPKQVAFPQDEASLRVHCAQPLTEPLGSAEAQLREALENMRDEAAGDIKRDEHYFEAIEYAKWVVSECNAALAANSKKTA